ncbi:MAG: PA2169 family four-helix-bundle protein [Planctomycetes bacterium]|nr:PA2169 family four-helix-bundle protein [Planctomycetota bacterium]
MNAIKNNPNWTCDTDALNALLGYQLSAVDTYDRAMTKFSDHHALAELQQIREDHARAVVLLRAKVTQFGALQVESPGPWSAFSEAITGSSNSLGLAALKQGEQHAINEYEEALRNEAVNPDCKELIRSELLPNDKVHLEKLDRLLGGMS